MGAAGSSQEHQMTGSPASHRLALLRGIQASPYRSASLGLFFPLWQKQRKMNGTELNYLFLVHATAWKQNPSKNELYTCVVARPGETGWVHLLVHLLVPGWACADLVLPDSSCTSYVCAVGGPIAVGAGTGWLSRGIGDMRRRELKQSELLSTCTLGIIRGQRCCPAGMCCVAVGCGQGAAVLGMATSNHGVTWQVNEVKNCHGDCTPLPDRSQASRQ